jgi:hypothetical protein
VLFARVAVKAGLAQGESTAYRYADIFSTGRPRGVMYLIQILLPLFDNEGAHFEPALYGQVRNELSDRFGGLTAYSRAPAEGRWTDAGTTRHDDIIVMEVMTDGVDTEWWRAYRKSLEERFKQTVIVVRAQMVSLL